ncbi:MAG: RNA polymerase sigma factor SigJ [Mycobacteriaceae bacterium]|nr:RNA polymerase sigma factor SigJ [Mycobacteriaceae bacterium]
MTDPNWLALQFEQHRTHLRSIAYDMLGSVGEAEDAVQECWIRFARVDSDSINEMRNWLTSVVGRICIDMLRARRSRRTDYVGSWLPEPLVVDIPEERPDQQAELTDSLGLALLIVLDSLSPTERLAFVLHDIFAVPFDEIGQIMGRTPAATRQLAVRARRRIQQAPQPDANVARQRRVVDAFLAAARTGDFDALVNVLAPDVVLRFDLGPHGRPPLSGAAAVIDHVLATAPRFVAFASPVLVNGAAGLLFGTREDPISVLGFTVVDGKIAALDMVAAPDKLRHLRLDT